MIHKIILGLLFFCAFTATAQTFNYNNYLKGTWAGTIKANKISKKLVLVFTSVQGDYEKNKFGDFFGHSTVDGKNKTPFTGNYELNDDGGLTLNILEKETVKYSGTFSLEPQFITGNTLKPKVLNGSWTNKESTISKSVLVIKNQKIT